jgi:hypothetical protein
VYPGIKDLPAHLRAGFRNEFIRYVMKQVANSEAPWTNPDLDSIQASYDIVYPIFPARIRHSDAVYHPVSISRSHSFKCLSLHKTISSLGVLRNHLASAAITAVQRHLTNTFRRKRLDTIHARADYITQLFKSDGDHPIIWREYFVGDIPNHPGVGGYKTARLFFVLFPYSLLTFYVDEARGFSIGSHP